MFVPAPSVLATKSGSDGQRGECKSLPPPIDRQVGNSSPKHSRPAMGRKDAVQIVVNIRER